MPGQADQPDLIAPADAEAVLADLGIPIRPAGTAPTTPIDGELAGACARIARKLRDDRRRLVGFLPADDETAVLPVLVHLGLALAELTDLPVALVDANIRHGGLSALVEGTTVTAADAVYAERIVRGRLVVFTAQHAAPPGQVGPQLVRLLRTEAQRFGHMLVDLTGFDRLGEHTAAAAALDGAAIVARTHHTHERGLAELAAFVRRDRFLGVILIGS